MTPLPRPSPALTAPTAQLLPAHHGSDLLGRRAGAAGAEPDAAGAHPGLHPQPRGRQVSGTTWNTLSGMCCLLLGVACCPSPLAAACDHPSKLVHPIVLPASLPALPPQGVGARLRCDPAVRRQVEQDQERQGEAPSALAVQVGRGQRVVCRAGKQCARCKVLPWLRLLWMWLPRPLAVPLAFFLRSVRCQFLLLQRLQPLRPAAEVSWRDGQQQRPGELESRSAGVEQQQQQEQGALQLP